MQRPPTIQEEMDNALAAMGDPEFQQDKPEVLNPDNILDAQLFHAEGHQIYRWGAIAHIESTDLEGGYAVVVGSADYCFIGYIPREATVVQIRAKSLEFYDLAFGYFPIPPFPPPPPNDTESTVIYVIIPAWRRPGTNARYVRQENATALVDATKYLWNPQSRLRRMVICPYMVAYHSTQRYGILVIEPTGAGVPQLQVIIRDQIGYDIGVRTLYASQVFGNGT